MYFSFTKIIYILTFSPTPLEHFLSYLRCYLWAIVLILPQIKRNYNSHIVYFLKLTYPSLVLPQMSACSLVLDTWSGQRWQPYLYPPPSPRAGITNQSNTGLRQIAATDGR